MTVPARDAPAQAGVPARDIWQTTCCIVGAGPAGMLLALFLARQGIAVTLLEAHADFDRDFRGDTVHPAILELLDEIGIADRMLAEVPHTKIRRAVPPGARFTVEFDRLRTRFPFIAMTPQAQFLAWLAHEAAHYPSFRLVLGANVRELIEDERHSVRGVRYQAADGWHDVRARLTVGADGRFSRVRHLSGLPPARKTSSPIDILWFRLPRLDGDPDGAQGAFGQAGGLVLLDRGTTWQLGHVIPKGGYQRLHAAGIEHLREVVCSLVPWLGDRTAALSDWHQVSLLSVESDLLPRWYRPGLLLIGDAAHTMSPLGGNGINYAAQDAAAAANVLCKSLARGEDVGLNELAAVQRRRFWPTRLTQAIVARIQDRVIAPALTSPGRASVPAIGALLIRSPWLRAFPLRWMAFGLWPVHLSPELRHQHSEPKELPSTAHQ